MTDMTHYYTIQRGPFHLLLDQHGTVHHAVTPRGILNEGGEVVRPRNDAEYWAFLVHSCNAKPLDESNLELRTWAAEVFITWAALVRETLGIDVPRALQHHERVVKAGKPVGHLPSGEVERLAAMRKTGRSYQGDDGLCYDTIRLWVDVVTGRVYHGAPAGVRTTEWGQHLRVLEMRHG